MSPESPKNKETSLSSPTEQSALQPNDGIGIAFSGGGFRAALFHIGVIRALKDAGLLGADSKISHVTGSSGGSIVATHLALNWEEYTNEKTRLDLATRDIIKFTQSDIRSTVLFQIPLFATLAVLQLAFAKFLFLLIKLKISYDAISHWHHKLDRFVNSTRLLMRQYDIFLRATSDRKRTWIERIFKFPWKQKSLFLEDLKTQRAAAYSSSGKAPPELLILGSNISKGSLCAFSERGFQTFDDSGIAPCGASILPISECLAASSAFPGIFSPVFIRGSRIGMEGDVVDTHAVADAGIIDNLADFPFVGTYGKKDAERRILPDVGHLIVSNASLVPPKVTRKFIWRLPLISVLRTVDIMQATESLRQEELLRKSMSAKRIVVSIHEQPEVESLVILRPEISGTLKNLRTDLDKFSNLEVCRLIEHGYQMASSKLVQNQMALVENFDGGMERIKNSLKGIYPSKVLTTEIERNILMGGSKRNFFSLRMLGFYLTLTVLIGGAICISYNYYLTRPNAVIDTWKKDVSALVLEVSGNPAAEFGPIATPVTRIQQKPDVNEPHYGGFDIIDDTRIFDYRKCFDKLDGKYNVYTKRILSLHRKKNDQSITIRFKTDGEEVIPHLNPKNSCKSAVAMRSVEWKFKSSSQILPGIAPEPLVVHDFIINVENCRDNFNIGVDARRAYTSQLIQPENLGVVATPLSNDVPRIRILTLFPDDHPARNFACFRKRVDDDSLDPYEFGPLYLEDPDGKWFVWEIQKPNPNYNYRIKWLWRN
ncbi:MAG: patatin-like phospholipase family protein [Planctomycetes bacterium]|nr:patatin-like phospholipase family protein [Planctomycetota bacterium]